MTLPPGRLRLVTSPKATGSPPMLNTMGMVVVAALAAKPAAGLPSVAMTATRRLTRSVASSGSRLLSFCAQRNSIATFLPSKKPVFAQAFAEARDDIGAAVRRAGVEESDHRNRRLLRVRGERPRNRPAKQRDEFAALHLAVLPKLNQMSENLPHQPVAVCEPVHVVGADSWEIRAGRQAGKSHHYRQNRCSSPCYQGI